MVQDCVQLQLQLQLQLRRVRETQNIPPVHTQNLFQNQPIQFYNRMYHRPLKQLTVYSKLVHILCLHTRGRDSSVGIATRYGLDGPGIELRRKRDFPHPSRPALEPTQPPVQWVPRLFRG
jgi:hypothetical protein